MIERLARDHVVAAGQVLAVAAQLDAREDDLRARGADVDADADQRDVVLQPDRVLLDRAIVVELEMVVVVIGHALVLVAEIVAQEMIGKRMAGGGIRIGLVVLSIRHRAFSSTLTVTALARAATRQARYQIRTSNGACGTARSGQRTDAAEVNRAPPKRKSWGGIGSQSASQPAQSYEASIDIK